MPNSNDMRLQDKQEPSHNDKLVTVAIHTYEKAQILKSILDSEGIPAVIHGIRMIEPIIPGNVRVRINESDLQDALAVIEQVDLSAIVDKDDIIEPIREILIPIDFSDYSFMASEFGFRLAHDLKCDVKLMHAYFTPFYPASVPFGDSFATQATDTEVFREAKERVEEDMARMKDKIKAKISSGDLPDVPYKAVLVEGLPEEEIISYSKKIRPMAIVMGTRGKSAKELDLIGSVTAEVMEGSRTPVFAIPAGSKISTLSNVKRVVFLTNFREREFRALEIMMEFLESHSVKLYLAHIAKKEDVWNEIKLSGFQNLLSERYPNIETEYKLIDQSVGLEESLEGFVQENNIDIISLSSSRRNIFARMFNPGIARRMIFHSDTPLLVIKGLK